jgi:predicted acylesterase/phospholipase RssA
MPSLNIDKLPKTPLANIALSLSGGGFRATAFHLGVLTYLSTKQLNEVSLLERTRILSTVSAGTFAGVKYATTLKKGGTISDCYKSLYAFMNDFDLVSEALRYLADDKNWKPARREDGSVVAGGEKKQRTLINAFAHIFYKEFESETFGLLWKETPPIHLKEISFNATEFNYALPFYFKKTEIQETGIGNKKIRIPLEVAKELRFADIIAASACFPFWFEPINFPDDFMYEGAEKLLDPLLLPSHVYDGDKIKYPVGLMDGSINDNQGVNSVIEAEERMRRYTEKEKEFRSDDTKAVDLYLISDASPPRMESYMRDTGDKLHIAGKWDFESLKYFGISCVLIGVFAMVSAFLVASKTLTIALTIFGTLDILVAFVLLVFSVGLTNLTRKIGFPEFIITRLLHFNNLNLGTVYNSLINRRNSVKKLISDVFIKHMRWFSYERVYGDPQWKTRLIMNAAFELTEEEVEKRRKKYSFLSPELSDPGPEIILAASEASGVGTTLWFTQKELSGPKNKLNTLIACGQFTVCFNLLEYFEKFIHNKEYAEDYKAYDEATKKAMEQLYIELLEDWAKFRKDPYWMVNEWNKKLE